jgi:hypothetical protein
MTTQVLQDFADRNMVLAPKLLPDGRVAFIMRLIYTAAVCVGPLADDGGYDDRWCYHSAAAAHAALAAWDGTGEPQGWHRHPFSGRRRPDGDAAKEYVAA